MKTFPDALPGGLGGSLTEAKADPALPKQAEKFLIAVGANLKVAKECPTGEYLFICYLEYFNARGRLVKKYADSVETTCVDSKDTGFAWTIYHDVKSGLRTGSYSTVLTLAVVLPGSTAEVELARQTEVLVIGT